MAHVQRIIRAAIGSRVDAARHMLDRFPELADVRFRRGGLPPRVAGWALLQSSVAAITLGRTVFLAKDAETVEEVFERHSPGQLDALLLHELRHVQQFREDKFFPIRYLWEILRKGYQRNRYEAEAREFARARLDGVERS